MGKSMKDVFTNVFNKKENYNQILSVITINNHEKRELKSSKLPIYTLAMGATAGAITLAYFIGKKKVNNKPLNLEMN